MVTTATSLRAELDDLLAEGVIAARQREATTFETVAGDRADTIVLFGAGGLGRRTLAGLRADGVEPVAFVDNNTDRWGTDIDDNGRPAGSGDGIAVAIAEQAGATGDHDHAAPQLEHI